MQAVTVHTETRRDFLGFNRARHAVIEAAILATRVHLIPYSEIEDALAFLAPAVAKTGGTEEAEAFRMLTDFIRSRAIPAESVAENSGSNEEPA